jgi:hypothetical protein
MCILDPPVGGHRHIGREVRKGNKPVPELEELEEPLVEGLIPLEGDPQREQQPQGRVPGQGRGQGMVGNPGKELYQRGLNMESVPRNVNILGQLTTISCIGRRLSSVWDTSAMWGTVIWWWRHRCLDKHAIWRDSAVRR